MTASIEFFPVGSGDMTLIRLASGKTILIDINIRQKADDDNEPDYPNVAEMLKDRLERDGKGRLYVDVFMLSHPDSDHIAGLETHFHLGAPSAYKVPENEDDDEKILIREMWSSPLIFRRRNKIEGALSTDAQKWRDEAKRRVKLYRDKDDKKDECGNFIRILGDDVHHKTEGIEDLITKEGEVLDEICRVNDSSFSAYLLSPKLVSDEEAEKLEGKNNSSVVIQFSINSRKDNGFIARFLTGGDAEVDIWKRIWGRNEKAPENLNYHLLQTPHHCSLGSLSYDQYSDGNGQQGKGEDCELDEDAYSALSQACDSAIIVASMDVPDKKSGRGLARRKYKDIADNVDGAMYCTMDDSKDKPLKIIINDGGPERDDGTIAKVETPQKPIKGKAERGYA